MRNITFVNCFGFVQIMWGFMLIGISLHVLIQNMIWDWRYVVVSTIDMQATSLERYNANMPNRLTVV